MRARALPATLAFLALGLPSAAPAATLALENVLPVVTERYPPDTMGAVGPGHVVALTNGGIRVYAKSGGPLVDDRSLAEFWHDAGVPVLDPFDPRVLFDPASGRFFAVAVHRARAPNDLLVAVSNGADPTEGWVGFAIDSDPTDMAWADFPMIGFDADAVTIASDMQPIGEDGLPIGIDVLVLPKEDLVASPPSVDRATLFPRVGIGEAGYAPQPVTRLDGGGLPNRLMSSAFAFFGVLQTSLVTGAALAPSFAKGPFVLIEPLPVPPAARAPGGGLFDTGDGHVASPIQVGGSIWAVHSVQGDSGRAAIRWLELDAATLGVLQTGVIEDPDRDFLYPSIAANELGHVVIGCSASSETLAPSAFAVLGETIGGATTFGELLLLSAGTGIWFGGGLERFGDYSATVVDPVDPRLFWTFQQVSGSFDVAIAALRVVPEPSTGAASTAAGLALLVLRRMRRARASHPITFRWRDPEPAPCPRCGEVPPRGS